MFSQYYYNQNGVWENVCPTILENIFLRPEEVLTEIRQKLVFLTKIDSVLEKINL